MFQQQPVCRTHDSKEASKRATYVLIKNFGVKLALIERRISIKKQVPGKVDHKMNA